MNWNLATDRRAGDFAATFIDEHVDEMAFLLEHRMSLLHRPMTRWPDVAPFDDRLLAQLNTWQAYGAVARLRSLEHVEAAVHTDDFADGDTITAMAYALGSGLTAPNDAGPLLELIVVSPEAMLPAWEQGLRMATGHALDPALHEALERAPPSIMRMLISTLGWRRQVQGEVVLRGFATRPLHVQETAALALAKVGLSSAAPMLRKALSKHPGSVPLATALLVLGDMTTWGHVRALASEHQPPPGALRLLAMRGELGDQELLRRAPDSLEAVTAMGILGSPELVPDLLRHLSAPARDLQIREAAAEALERMSGAGLREVVGVSAIEDDHEPPEVHSERASRDPERWSAYFGEHAAQFKSRARYRRGQTFRPTTCLEEVAEPASPFARRQDAAEEWTLHTGRPTRFEPDSWIETQRAALKLLQRPS